LKNVIHRAVRLSRGPAAVVFIGCCVYWLALPVRQTGIVAIDARAFQAAGLVASQHPSAVYPIEPPSGDFVVIDPQYLAATCEVKADPDCATSDVAFLSPPVVLPLLEATSRVGGELGVRMYRMVGALCFVVGAGLLWRRFAKVSTVWPLTLAASALLLTPFVRINLELGQITPLLFLLACLPIERTSRKGSIAVGGLLGVSIAFKMFPLALVAVAIHRRRWTLVAGSAATVGGLLVVAALRYPLSTWSAFFDGVQAMNREFLLLPFNGSFDRLLHRWVPSWQSGSLPMLAFLALRVVVAVAVVWYAARRRGADVEWVITWLVCLMVIPQVWNHYFVLALPAVIVVCAAHRFGAMVAPALLALTIPLALAPESDVELYGPIVVTALVAVLCWMAALRPADRSDEPEEQVVPDTVGLVPSAGGGRQLY
jgi:Glycosyltransferase family 87